MLELITIDVSSGKRKGMGQKIYKTIPRIGEWVEIEMDGIANMFEVIMIAHSSTGGGSDVFVRHLPKSSQDAVLFENA